MPDLPNGRYGITVTSWAFSYSGVLDTTANPPTYQRNAVSNFSATNGSIGWTATVNGVSVTFSGGTYNAGPPATVTGGTASASGMQNSGWEVDALGNGNYDVTAHNTSAADGKLVVSGPTGSQSADYRFGGTGQPQSCSNPVFTSGQIGWSVTDPNSGITYTFTNGVYIRLASGPPHLIFDGRVVFPGLINTTDDTWTADSSTGPFMHGREPYKS
jgi:hypothetical protein